MWKEKGNVTQSSRGFIQQFTPDPLTFRVDLPADIQELFAKIGYEQRGHPEDAMLAAQMAIGGGVVSYCIEHVGDLYHRMTHHAKYGKIYPEIIKDKAVKTLEVISSDYGFQREFEGNLKSNSVFQKIPYDEFAQKAADALRHYAEQHRKLPVYNKMQWLAREASISIGEQDFSRTKLLLQAIVKHVDNPVKFVTIASSVLRNKDGEIVEYKLKRMDLDMENVV